MAKLIAKVRNKLADASFALPAQRKYPIEDARHDRNAISRASQQENAGNLTPSQADAIKAKARAALKRK